MTKECNEKNQSLLLHLDAGYNLARWLLKNEQDARDVVQDAFIRAYRFDGTVENVKTWFLTTVRNTAYSSLRKKKPLLLESSDLDQFHQSESILDPESQLLQNADLEKIQAALFLIPEEQREIFVLREIEELTYEEIATILQIPLGTVMSRLARARTKLQKALCQLDNQGKESRS